MTNPNKAKGSRWESALRNEIERLQTENVRLRGLA